MFGERLIMPDNFWHPKRYARYRRDQSSKQRAVSEDVRGWLLVSVLRASEVA